MRRTRSLLALVALATPLAMACGGRQRPATRPSVEYLTPYGRPERPFSPAVRVGEMIYVSGQIGMPLAGATAPLGGIEAETRQALENIRDILERSGSSLDRVVKCTVMLADIRDYDAMNAVYASFFPTNKPARSTFATTGLALGARVEIECWATAGR